MNRADIEDIYRREVLDRGWWGDFPESQDLLEKIFPRLPMFID